MNATVLVVCYKSKTLSNGEHPLMLRIAKNGKSRYKSLKVSVNAKFWDFDESSAYRILCIALKWQVIKQETPTTQVAGALNSICNITTLL